MNPAPILDCFRRSLPCGSSLAHLTRLAAIGLAVLIPMADAAPAFAQQHPAAPKPLLRTVTLRELGLSKGIQFSGFNGYRELFFPAPQVGLEGAVLRLRLRAGAAFAGQRHIQVSAGRSILMSQAIGTSAAPDTIDVPIDPALVEEGFLRVTLRYSGALNADRCLDERVAGDFLAILPESGLEMRLGASSLADVRSVASLMPQDVQFVLPDRDLQRGEIVAILRMASLLRRRGGMIALVKSGAVQPNATGAWTRGLVLVGRDNAAAAEATGRSPEGAGISVLSTKSGPALALSGDGSDLAAQLLVSRWRSLAAGSTLSVKALDEGSATDGKLSFEEIGLALQNGELSDRVQFDVVFSSDQLPRGTVLDGIRLELAVGASADEREATIFAFLNGHLLGSRRVSGAVPTTLTLPVPVGLVGRDNSLSVRIQRPPRVGVCVEPAPPQPVQLLPSSTLELANAGELPSEFFHLPQFFRGGVDVVLPDEPAAQREALAHFILTAIDALPDHAPITLRLESRPTVGEQPFIVVSRSEPVDTDPRLRFDQGALSISRSDGKRLLDLSEGQTAPTIVQVLRTSKAAGLWLRPDRDVPEPRPQPVRLDRGDVAIMDKTGVALAFSTQQKQVVSVVYHDIRSWMDLAGEYRPWIVGAVWLVLTLLLVRVLAGFYRRGSK